MNIPNLFTLLRFLLIPVFIYYFFSETNYSIHISIYVFILAGLTDVIDGFIARKFNQITKLGIVLDPLADKLMLITALISITIRYDIPIWILSIVGLKEILMICGAATLYNNDIVVPANVFGKLSTVLSYAAILGVTFNWPYNRVLLYLFITTTIFALIVYVTNFVNIKKHQSINLVKK